MRAVHTRLVMLASVTAFAAVVGGCGVPYSSDFDPVASDEVPFELANTTSTSTTTTTTIALTTTVPASTTTTMPETTTTEVTVAIEIYYVSGDGLIEASRRIVGEASLERVLDVMKSLPSGDEGQGLRAVIPPDADIDVEAEAGVATVDLPSEIFDTAVLPREDHRLVFGQIVLTLTAQPGIGQVLFLLDGEESPVRLPNAQNRAAGEVVSREDYIELEANFTPLPTTTTSTTTTTTTTTTPTTTTPPETTSETATVS